ncbi:MAG TPA: RNA polymerase sigma factor [Polyangia bacterium]|nr:RNA polymerase sigma factor [Polyangia bacterium]
MDGSESSNQDAAFEQRIGALYPQLFRLALRLCRNHADAHDLAQDAVERGLRNRGQFRTGGLPDRWMFTILRRIFLDDFRGRRRRARVPLLEEHEAITVADPEPPEVWENFGLEDVERALLCVDRMGREVFSLFAFDRLPQQEIARRLSISAKTVATRMFRTRGKLRELLESGAYRRQLVLLPPAEPAAQTPALLPAGPHAPRTRAAAVRRRARVSASGVA